MLEIRDGQEQSQSALRLLRYIDEHPSAVLISSAIELADKIGVSNATVIRTIQGLGYDGLPHLKSVLAGKLDQGVRGPAEKVRVTTELLRRSAGETAVDLVLSSYEEGLGRLRSSEVADEVRRAVAVLDRADTIFFHGPGPTHSLMDLTADHLMRVGRQAMSLTRGGTGFADSLLRLRTASAVVMLSYGRAVPEAKMLKSEIKRLDGSLVVLTDNPRGVLADGADVVITVPRAEVGNMTLYGPQLAILESIVLSLTAADEKRSLKAADRLDSLRERLSHGGTIDS